MDQKDNLPDIILIIGAPGSGKGTLCKQIIDKYENYVHISIGDILRDFKYDTQSEKGKTISELFANYEKTGTYPPFDVAADIILDHIRLNKGKICLVDGFQKNMNAIYSWEKIIEPFVNLKLAVILECNLDLLFDRLVKRCGNRKDGKLEIIKKRLDDFKIEGEKIFKYFKARLDKDDLVFINTEKLPDEVLNEFEDLIRLKNLI
jgi:adenylate kinase family enzyme